MIAADGATEMTRLAAPVQTDPVLLALPGRQTDCLPSGEPCPEPIHLLETGSGPRIETALLKELLARNPHLEKWLADPTEARNNPDPLAGINAYKHRLHALRCENVNLRLRVHELETQLSRMRATRGWQLLEKYRRWRRTVFGWLQPAAKSEPRP
jgi:hypothetical protein